MSVTLHLHKTHRQFTDDTETFEAQRANDRRLHLSQLVERFPGMRKALFADRGKLKNQIEIYLNMESAYPDELKRGGQGWR